MIRAKNVFSGTSKSSKEEQLEQILSSSEVRIEIILSPRGYSAPSGEWFDQNENEFVIVLKGEAELLFEDGNQKVKMKRGDYINIPAHVRHCVERVQHDTYWLEVFYK